MNSTDDFGSGTPSSGQPQVSAFKHPWPKIYPCFDAPLRWLIESSSNGHEPYLVDLGAHNGAGECQCADWKIRAKAKLDSGAYANCKHIRIARERFTNWAIDEFHRRDKNPEIY